MRSLLVVLGLAFATQALSFSDGPTTRRLRTELREADGPALARRTDRALGALFTVADRLLRREGHRAEADRLAAEWSTRAHYVERAYLAEGMGDHAPYSKWLEDQYFLLLTLLGPELMEAWHLDDIGVFNWGIVVTLHLEQLGDDPIDLPEYKLHAHPFLGVVSYWSVNLGCAIGTWGLGWISMVCTPVAMIAEFTMVEYVAPRFSTAMYERFY